MSHRILLADDHQMFREALRLLLARLPECEVVGETGDGLDVLPLVHATRPNLLCLDIDMPGLNGIEITRRIGDQQPTVKVIALSAFADRDYVMDMLAAGAAAYVTKAAAGDELLRAIEAVGRGRSYLCPDATDAVKAAAASRSEERRGVTASLGAREIQVLRLVAVGFTSGQIAAQLDIAPSTVEVHRRNIMRKLGVDGVVGMTRYAIRNGLVPGD